MAGILSAALAVMLSCAPRPHSAQSATLAVDGHVAHAGATDPRTIESAAAGYRVA